MKSTTKSLPPFVGVASLNAASANREDRTVEMIFYSGSPVFRFSFFDDKPYELEFEMSKKAANFDRLNNGASLIDSHRTFSGVGGILGVVEKAWLSGGEARARVRFSKRPEVEPIWNDVLDGVIRNVSMGTYILNLEEVTKPGAEMKRFRATSWEPYEISLVSVPADSGARVLQAAASAEKRLCTIMSAEALADAPERRAMSMSLIKVRLLADNSVFDIEEGDFDEKLHSKDLNTPKRRAPEPESAPTDPDDSVAVLAAAKAAKRKVDDAIEADKAYAAEVRRAALHYKMPEIWAQRQINLKTPIEQVIELASAERAKIEPNIMPSGISVGTEHDSAVEKRGRMAEALVLRAARKPPTEAARQFAGFSFADCAYETLSWRGMQRGLDPRHNPVEAVDLALHASGDYPLLLGNILNKILMPAYDGANPTFRLLAAQKTFKDFRAHNFTRRGDFPLPKVVGENGEFTYGTMSESKEVVTLVSYGRIIGFSRQMLINDDLEAFQDMATAAGQRVADFQNAQFFTSCILAGAGLGPTLNDTIVLYNASHNNVAGAGVLDNTRLADARAKLMAQTSLDGLKLNITGSILLVSPASLTTAETLVATIVPNQASSVNPFAGKLTPVGDANITGTRFYVLADPARVPNYIYGSLTGQVGPRTEVRAGFEVDGVEFKLAFDFGTGAIDFRGGVTGAGA